MPFWITVCVSAGMAMNQNQNPNREQNRSAAFYMCFGQNQTNRRGTQNRTQTSTSFNPHRVPQRVQKPTRPNRPTHFLERKDFLDWLIWRGKLRKQTGQRLNLKFVGRSHVIHNGVCGQGLKLGLCLQCSVGSHNNGFLGLNCRAEHIFHVRFRIKDREAQNTLQLCMWLHFIQDLKKSRGFFCCSAFCCQFIFDLLRGFTLGKWEMLNTRNY